MDIKALLKKVIKIGILLTIFILIATIIILSVRGMIGSLVRNISIIGICAIVLIAIAYVVFKLIKNKKDK